MLPGQSSISQTLGKHNPHAGKCRSQQQVCAKPPLCPLQQLTVNEDVNSLELFQCLIHRCHDGLGLPDFYRKRQALLTCCCNQLLRGLQKIKRGEILSGTLSFSKD